MTVCAHFSGNLENDVFAHGAPADTQGRGILDETKWLEMKSIIQNSVVSLATAELGVVHNYYTDGRVIEDNR